MNNKIVGTGFVCSNPRVVFTCEHLVSDTHPMQFLHNGSLIEVQLVFSDSVLDFAVLGSVDTICSKPYKVNKSDVEPGDKVYYVGHDSESLSFRDDGTLNIGYLQGEAVVVATGTQLNKSGVVEFIEFEGNGKPGASGSPIFNEDLQIIGMITHGWDILPMKGNRRIRVNRGFVIPLIRWSNSQSE